MKRQRLVSRFTPSGLQEWLEQELENRGIDSFYARSVISLLQQDCVDIEPQECHHNRNHHLRVLHKYGGPENLYYVTKSKHQKWKTFGKHILLTSTLPCCKAAAYDLERIMKKAAIDCLKTASDYDNDIEELINEVWIKLKNKSMKGETEERTMRNCNTLADSFFIPPSSPTGEIEKYFAAFPPLSNQNEHSVEVTQQEMGKNDWWDRCILKRKALSPNEETLNSNSPSFQVNKNMQHIVPYRSLKTIKNIFDDSMMKSLTCVSIKKNISKTNNSKVNPITENPSCSLTNLFVININNMLMNRKELLDYLSNSAIGQKTINDRLNAYLKTQATVEISRSEHLNEFSVFMLHHKSPVSIAHTEFSNNRAVVMNENSGQIPIKESASNTKREEIDYQGADIHLRKDSVFHPDYKYPCLDLDAISAQPHDKNNVETIANSAPCEEMFCNLMNNELCSERKSAFINKDVVDDYVYDNSEEFYPFTDNISCNKDKKFIINHSFNPLNSSRTSDEAKSNFPDLEQNNYIENMSSIQFENSPSDDEIYYSDEESNAILSACNEENFSDLLEAHLASKTNFHPVLENNLSLHELPKKSQNVEMEGISFLNASQYNPSLSLDTETKKIIINKKTGQEMLKVLSASDDGEIYYSDEESNAILYNCNVGDFGVSSEAHLAMETNFQPVLETVRQNYSSFTLDTETKKVLVNKKSGQELLKKILSIGNRNISELINCRGQFSSSYDRFSFIQPNDIKHNEEFEHFQKGVFEKESELLIEPRYPSETSNDQKIFASDLPKDVVQSGYDTSDKKWLFHWGDNHNFISRTWQKDFVPAEQNYNQPFYDVEVRTALCKEIKGHEDESLKGLSSVPGISKTVFESELPKSNQNVQHSNFITSQIRNLPNDYDGKTALYFGIQGSQSFTADQIQFNGQSPIVNDFTFHNVGNEIVPALQCGSGYSVSFESNPFMAAASSGSSAFSNTNETINSFKNYADGGGWSLASDPVTDYYCDNLYERSCSVSDVDLEESYIGYLEFHRKKQHCTSETSDVELPTNKEIETQLHKRMEQKFVPRKRPCIFFLQGTCTRSDCKYSHDVSTITCRFWKEGSCFKGLTCPFYHGFVKRDDKRYPENSKCLRTHSPDLSYSLDSETDFPSLSSTKSEVSKMKSAMNVIQIKGPKRRRKEK
ncbi:uncharacterized protein TNIN_283721 [Trichonephila inaurata madagascariensis]|uniref:C3H1-type domain-containing protein n=1 Tax=Trichonephila inaurata madagascariensis TaxID=2747483 RepID=A0A8X7CTX4_9ARAC|nr:uncharacterized protein TNIN_283721 [Trichonephila inaurata madagascariensis]